MPTYPYPTSWSKRYRTGITSQRSLETSQRSSHPGLVPPSLRENKSTLLCPGTTMVERAPCRCQDLRVADQLPQKT